MQKPNKRTASNETNTFWCQKKSRASAYLFHMLVCSRVPLVKVLWMDCEINCDLGI